MEDEESNPPVPAIQMELDNSSVGESNPIMDMCLLDSPTKTLPSPVRSKTDSVDQVLGPNFNSMGYDPDTWAAAKAAYPNYPSQNSQKE